MYNTLTDIPLEMADIIRTIEVRTNKPYTTEQKLLMANFNRSLISFADPGTGKTHSTVGGIILLNLYHKVPVDNIVVMSFTKVATTELNNRYTETCKKLNMRNNINFRTLDSMCYQVIMTHFEELGMEKVKMRGTASRETIIDFLLEAAAEQNIPLNPNRVGLTLRAIESLDRALVFEPEHVETKLEFQKTKLTYDQFTALRNALYGLYKALDQVPRNYISLYTLEILSRNKEISDMLKAKNKVMIVDEFQDMSLLKLRLLSLMCEELVVVGDLKQQIYGFNGASSEIVGEYKTFFPNHKELFLSQSFRCDHTIVEYAKKLIAPNKMYEDKFKGVERQGSVEIHKGMFDVYEFADKIAEEYNANEKNFPERIMFLYRNNQSCIPIVDALYKKGVPVIASKYTPAHQIPVIEDLVALTELAINPTMLPNIAILNKIVPEFMGYDTINDNPLYKIMKQENCSVFECNYNFRNPEQGEFLMRQLSIAKEEFSKGEKCNKIFNAVYPIYSKLYLPQRGMYLENPPEFYIGLVADLTANKGFSQFKSEEMKKVAYLQGWADLNEGIRCYTFHASKGTEADRVVILDADEGIVPNTKKLQEIVDVGAHIDAARNVRNERSLVFVAVTRAKRRLEVYYRNELATIFTENNSYSSLDKVYEEYSKVYDDVGAFEKFFNM